MADIDYFEDIQWLPLDLGPIDSSLFFATDSLSQFEMNPSDIPPQERFMELPMESENDFSLAASAELNTGAQDSPLEERALEVDHLQTSRQPSQVARNPVAKRLSLPIKLADVGSTRHDKKPRVVAPNPYGRKGVPRCANCRKWRQKVSKNASSR